MSQIQRGTGACGVTFEVIDMWNRAGTGYSRRPGGKGAFHLAVAKVVGLGIRGTEDLGFCVVLRGCSRRALGSTDRLNCATWGAAADPSPKGLLFDQETKTFSSQAFLWGYKRYGYLGAGVLTKKGDGRIGYARNMCRKTPSAFMVTSCSV